MDSQDHAGLIDSHAHIQAAQFATDLGDVIRRARESGVEKIIVVGGAGDLSSNHAALELARSFPGLFATVGLHPHDAKGLKEEDLKGIKDLIRSPQVVAIGETGLDFYYDHSPRPIQMELFSRFIRMAQETGLPLIVHDRKAHKEISHLLRDEGKGKIQGVIHCFTGDYDAAREYLDLGFYLSFTGIISFKNAAPLRDVVRRLPLERILVETDSPYLAPVPHRGKRNEPAFVRFVAEIIAGVRGMPLEEVAAVTTKNTEDLFKI
ncbi:MAG: TatD family hydrolase [Candidatus Binatia bacterium]